MPALVRSAASDRSARSPDATGSPSRASSGPTSQSCAYSRGANQSREGRLDTPAVRTNHVRGG
eukprot:5099609-Pyramimonas_sp.AAC.1